MNSVEQQNDILDILIYEADILIYEAQTNEFVDDKYTQLGEIMMRAYREISGLRDEVDDLQESLCSIEKIVADTFARAEDGR